MDRIGFIGTGVIAGAMARGIAGQGYDILVSQRGSAMAARLVDEIADVSMAPNAEVVERSDMVVLCLMADQAEAAVKDLPWRAGQVVLSVMADVTVARVESLVAPAGPVARTIPLPFIARGGCPLPVFPASRALEEVFGDRNAVFEVRDEAALEAHMVVTALASTILDELRAGSNWLASHTGNREGAVRYTLATLSGYLADLTLGEGADLIDDALADLSTAGGFNATLRDRMRAAGMTETLQEGLAELGKRVGLGPSGG